MSLDAAARKPTAGIQWVTTMYARLLVVGFAFIPAYLIAYLYSFQDPKLLFEDHAFHEAAFFKQKTAYEMCPCDWSSDVCSSDLHSSSITKQKSLSGF